MAKSSLIFEVTLLVVICLGIHVPGAAHAQAPTKSKTAQAASVGQSSDKERSAADSDSDAGAAISGKWSVTQIRFSFEQEEWQEVIPWFADQAGFSLQPVADWPEGTFDLVDDSEYTVIDALDQLNHALRIRNPPYTLIRNRNLLVLVKADQADAQNYPPELIETVPVSELDQRGKYELMRCVFEFGELNCLDFEQQLQQLVSDENQSAFHLVAGANQIIIRETGATLRLIRDIIMTSRKLQSERDSSLIVYRLKHVDPDSFLFVARELLGIAEDNTRREDGSLGISAEPLSDRLFVKGTQAGLDQFQQVAKLVDVAPDQIEDGGSLDVLYLDSYPVTSDPALAFATLQTFLAGRDGVKMAQDEVTGALVVMGRKADHKVVADTLATIEGGNGEQFAIVQLENADPATVILTLRSLWGQTSELEPQGPVLLGNSQQGTVIVRGTPTEVGQVRDMIAKLDNAATQLQDGPRTSTRVIPMEGAKRDEVLGLLEDYWPSKGRNNRLNLIMPEDRPTLKDRFRRLPGQSDPGGSGLKFDEERRPMERPSDAGMRRRSNQPANPAFGLNEGSHQKSGSNLFLVHAQRFGSNLLARSSSLATCLISSRFFSASLPVALIAAPRQLGFDTSGQAGSLDSSTTPSRRTRPDYTPPPEVQSVPGDDIQVKATEGGIVITSKDLDALDDLEDLIFQQLGQQSEVQAPTFFYLKHRYAGEMVGFLEGYFGIAGSSDDDAGVGGMMGGMLDNMMGGGTGDLLGGLLGGGDGLGGLSLLEGDVRFGTDSKSNMVYVTGATGTDLTRINDIIEILDQPDPPQDLELVGQFRTIPIVHRDPEEVKLIIEVQLSDLIESSSSGEGGGGGNQQGNQNSEQLTKLVQQMAGGGGEKGGGGAGSATDRPKARLGVDAKTSQLLVTGPEFIYKLVKEMVKELDKAQLSEPPIYVVIPNGGRNSELLKRNLKAIFGPKIEITDDDEADDSSSSSSNASSSSSDKTESDNNANAQQAQQAFQRQIRELSRQQQRGGGDNGGGNRGGGGGGNRGGGGGGNRGGGGGGNGGGGGR